MERATKIEPLLIRHFLVVWRKRGQLEIVKKKQRARGQDAGQCFLYVCAPLDQPENMANDDSESKPFSAGAMTKGLPRMNGAKFTGTQL